MYFLFAVYITMRCHKYVYDTFTTNSGNLLLVFLISLFRCFLNVVCFLLCNSPASEVYMPTFRNTLFHLHRLVGVCRMLYNMQVHTC
jgi:hypothetical protein